MTYSHALRYLTALPDAAPQAVGTPPLTVKFAHPPLLLCFTRNKLGSAAACMVASILKQAGISYLHWIDDDSLEPKRRFFINGCPITPPVLSQHAASWQTASRAAGREGNRAERCAGVLSLCAAQQDCRVILLESPLSVCHVGLFALLTKKIRAITLLSDGKTVPRTAANPATTEIITPAYGMTMHSTITDICAGNDCKMVTIPTTAVVRKSLTVGGQTVVHTTKAGEVSYRLPSVSRVATDAASIALYCIHSLCESGLTVPPKALSDGLLYAPLAFCATLYSASPLILIHAVVGEQELSFVSEDVATVQSCTDSPVTVWTEAEGTSWPDSTTLYTREEWPTDPHATLLLVGSPAWIEQKLSLRKQKKAPKTEKM